MAAAKKSSSPQSVTDQLRSAVKRTFDATVGDGGFSRERAQELVDEVTEAADRWGRGAVDELRNLAGEELSSTRKRIEQLEKRLAELEGRIRPSKKTAAKPAAKKPAAKPKPKVSKPKVKAKATVKPKPKAAAKAKAAGKSVTKPAPKAASTRSKPRPSAKPAR